MEQRPIGKPRGRRLTTRAKVQFVLIFAVFAALSTLFVILLAHELGPLWTNPLAPF